MKRISLLAIFLFLAAGSAYSQYRPGMNTLGGTASFQGTDPGDNTLILEPTYGYSVSDKMMIGVNALFEVPVNVDFMWGVAPFLRGNMALSDKAGAFALVGPALTYTSLTDDVYAWGFGATAQAGLYYFILPRFSLEAVLGQVSYTHQSIRFDGEEVGDSNAWTIGLATTNVAVSFLYHF